MLIHRPTCLALIALLSSSIVARLPAEPLTPVTMQLDWIPNVQFAGIYMAKEQGYYAEAGLDVTIKPVLRGKNQVDTVLDTPGFTFGSAESNVLLSAYTHGAAIKALTAMFQDSPIGWISLNKTVIETFSDLVGKRVGLHQLEEPAIDIALANTHLKRSDLNLSKDGDDLKVLMDGEVDAVQGYVIDEYAHLQILSGNQAHIVMAKDYGYVAYSQVIFAPDRLVLEHPDVTRKFLEASRRGWEYALAHREETVDLMIKNDNPQLDRAYQLASLNAVADLVSPAGKPPLAPMSPKRWTASQKQFVKLGLIPKGVNLKSLLKYDLSPPKPPMKWYEFWRSPYLRM